MHGRGTRLTQRLPDATLDFWLITFLAVTVGQTLADYLSIRRSLGVTTAAATVLLVSGLAIAVQLLQKRYMPLAYWTAVVLASVAGTLLSDVLVVTCSIAPVATASLFAALLLIIFFFGTARGGLSGPDTQTAGSELLYWLATVSTFALGTSADDWVSERMGLGYLVSSLVFIEALALTACSYVLLQAKGAVHFWLAYIFLRCGGASLGNYMAQSSHDGGLGMGSAISSVVLLVGIAIVAIVATVEERPEESI
jgi:uncharacterized membrane-anchored protein